MSLWTARKNTSIWCPGRLDGTCRRCADAAVPLLSTPANERNAVVSPNGRWLAYESDESGQVEVHVRPFPDVKSGHWQISTSGGTHPLWGRDGTELFYYAPRTPPRAGELMVFGPRAREPESSSDHSRVVGKGKSIRGGGTRRGRGSAR